MPERALIVDDHAGFRGVTRRLLQEMGRLVVGEAGTEADASRKRAG
jgi:DNA-binding NarL/FixJ family response regulator